MKVDLIIPFYNENQNLEILCKELSYTIPKLKHDYKVLFIASAKYSAYFG